jgi:hypothetical protein
MISSIGSSVVCCCILGRFTSLENELSESAGLSRFDIVEGRRTVLLCDFIHLRIIFFKILKNVLPRFCRDISTRLRRREDPYRVGGVKLISRISPLFT